MKKLLLLLTMISSISYGVDKVIVAPSGSLKLRGNTTANIQTYATGAWQDRLTVLNNGKVGIGTTAPNVRLETKASAGETDVANFIANDFVVNSTGSALVIKSIDGNGLNAIDSYKNGGGATQHLSLQRNGGSVGIGLGSGSPVGRLDVKSSGENSVAFSITDNDSASRIFEVDQETGGRGSAYLRDASNNLKIKLDTGGDSYLLGGNVGIATSTPQSLIDIGNMEFTTYADYTFTSQTGGGNFTENLLTISGIPSGGMGSVIVSVAAVAEVPSVNTFQQAATFHSYKAGGTWTTVAGTSAGNSGFLTIDGSSSTAYTIAMSLPKTGSSQTCTVRATIKILSTITGASPWNRAGVTITTNP